MLMIPMGYLIAGLLLMLLAVAMLAAEQALIKRRETVNLPPWIDFDSDRLTTLDGEHVLRWLFAGTFLASGALLQRSGLFSLDWVITLILVPLFFYVAWFEFNLLLHRAYLVADERSVWECVPGVWELRELLGK